MDKLLKDVLLGVRCEDVDCFPSQDCSDIDSFLNEIPSPGYGVLCLSSLSRHSFEVDTYLQGKWKKEKEIIFVDDWPHFRQEIERVVEIREEWRDENNRFEEDPKSRQPWALFNSKGEREEGMINIYNGGIFLVFEGGQFIWPGVRVGFRREVGGLRDWNSLVLRTLSLQPLVFIVEEVLDDQTIDLLISESVEHMQQSPVAHKDVDVGKSVTEWRTSTTHMINSEPYELLQKMDQNMADLVRIPVSHQELTQVLRYLPGQKYGAHTDYFQIEEYRQNEWLCDEILHQGTKNRLLTIFLYLNDVSVGGSTWFPRGNDKVAESHGSCEPDVGLHSYPKKGKIIIFYSLHPDGSYDDFSVHGACAPLEDQTKWAANKWIWNKPEPFR